jgi:mannose-1-phosphate guanylyltransferase
VKALVLCGGLGTRLGALTQDTPKSMLPLADRPLLGYALALLARHGFRDVAINLHFHGELIERYVGDGRAHGVRVTYSPEPVLLGTAGTVRSLAPFFGSDDEALVVYGDLLLEEDIGAMLIHHRQCEAAATLLLHRRARSNSIVTMDSATRITQFVERPPEDQTAREETWVNSGVAILSRWLRERLPDRVPSDLPRDVYSPLVSDERLFGFRLRGYRCAIDSPARYEEAQRAVLDGRVPRLG